MTDGELYKQLRTTVVNIGERLEQKHILSGLAVTNLSEIGENSPEIVEEILEIGFLRGDFDIFLLVKKEELLKMRKKKFPFSLRSYFIPEAFLTVSINSQKVICTIYSSMIPKGTMDPEGVVKEELRKFVRLHKREGIEEFVINYTDSVNTLSFFLP